ncbi:MAG: MotA/TolQ/ExbB proton channel family protein [Rickettsiales bacterium]|jgi:biopolymer transport protein TolQ|nr:MotA/TolQ/ExbB proton channel family protein [Rickettsiales bacterium]
MQSVSLQIFVTLFHADFITKFIMLSLIFMSIYSWAIIFEKFFKFKLLTIKTTKFEKVFWSGDVLEDIYQKVKNNAKCPAVVVFIAAMQEWSNSDVPTIIKTNDNNKKIALKDRIFDIMMVTASRSVKKLKSGMNFLLISSSSSTLLGLLGTAWGISSSLKSIAVMKEATLATVAPGISAALITTIMGMFTAIPALVAYYAVRAKINDYEDELNNFCIEVLNILSKEVG